MAQSLDELRARIKARLGAAAVVASDETTTRIEGVTHWHWTFVTDNAVLHEIAPRRAKSVPEAVLGRSRPEVWISDRYGGQQELAARHQVCLAHVLRDVQYAIERGDVVFAPKLRELLCWTIRIGKRRETLRACPKSSGAVSTACETPDEELDDGDRGHGGAGFDQRLDIFGEPTVAAEPGEGALDDP